MCTSIVTNFKKTIIGWNLDLLDMEWKISASDESVYILIWDNAEGWLPLFGVNNRGDFVGMPTCWPYDKRSDKTDEYQINIINLDIDLLLKKRTFEETLELVKTTKICSVPNLTFQAQLSDKSGNVLQITPGQYYKYIEKPKYSVMTNFSLQKMDSEYHPWYGIDRYNKANELLSKQNENFDIKDMFNILKEVSQTVCPTVVSMVYDATLNKVYWCENQNFNDIKMQQLKD